ncbi:protein kinase subdomain-containing protein PKL/CAK/Fmp29 [Hymenopellis radicata]|nr:protein kinase subdomain-containing protein PKL/CAK/Fmp29 [Hymenopellis radicata]
MLALNRLESAVLRLQCAAGRTSMRWRTISTSSIYEHSTGRWLYNDAEQRLARYSPFNVQELYKTACESLDAGECTSMVKILEASDSRSRIFRMTFDNGKTAIARIPLPRLLGNVSSVIASEVATAEFCRGLDLFGFGVPQVYAWSKDPSNPVGSAYIITEDVVGTSLSNEWSSLRGDPLGDVIAKLALDFMQLQTDDLPSELQSRPLFHDSFISSRLHLFPDDVSEKLRDSAEKFRIGPIASSEWWCIRHDDPEADRGPWRNYGEFIEAAARLELRTLEKHRADPKSLRFSSSTVEDLDEVQGLLEQILVLAPHLSATLIDPHPVIGDTLTDIVLGHPKLLASNIIVPHLTPDNAAERMKALTYTDWQCAVVLPFPMHLGGAPPIFRYDGGLFELPSDPTVHIELPSNIGTLSQEQQDVVCTHHDLATRRGTWVRLMLTSWPPFLFTYDHVLYPAISILPHLILRACSEGPRALRETLNVIYQVWDTEQWGPCPITFSEEELAAFGVDFEEYLHYLRLVSAARKRLGCNRDGWVPTDKYDEASALLAEIRTEWLARNSNAPFPFTDGAWSAYLS